MSSTDRKIVTMRDIAQRCQVNHATVSRAMNHDPRVKPSTAARIRAVAEEMGYDPTLQVAARRLSLQKSGTTPSPLVGMAMSQDFTEVTYFAKVLSGIVTQLGNDHVNLMVTYLKDPTQPEAFERLQEMYLNHGVRGFIVIAPYFPANTIPQQLIRDVSLGDPTLVFLLERMPGQACIITDDHLGTYRMVKQLLDLGHRHFLHFTHRFFGERLQWRLAGMRQALAEYDLNPDEHVTLFDLPSRYWLAPTDLRPWLNNTAHVREEECAFLLECLAEHPEITTILALNDASALHAWYGLQSHGWRVPDDISIVGYDDTDGKWDGDGHNLLSTVRLPLVEAGQEAAKLIQAVYRGDVAKDTQVILQPEICIRQSVANEPTRRR